MTTTITTDPTYIAERLALLRANEGFSTDVYFDTNGIPTIGIGVALLTSTGAINGDNMQIIANVLGANSREYLRIQQFAQRVSAAIVGTPSMKNRDIPLFPLPNQRNGELSLLLSRTNNEKKL